MSRRNSNAGKIWAKIGPHSGAVPKRPRTPRGSHTAINRKHPLKKKTLVTGGAGFIGSHIVDRLIEAGHEVAIVDNLSTGFRENLNPAARFHEADIGTPEFYAIVEEEQPVFLIHLAAQIDVRISADDPRFDAKTNVLGTLNVLEACARTDVSKFIFASTGGAIYGEPETLPATEDTPPKPLSHYGTGKLAAEHYVQLYGRLHNLQYTILRFPNVYGPRQNPEGEAGVCAILAQTMLRGHAPTLYGRGTPVRDYVYVDDIARATLLALRKAEGQTLNLGSGKGTTVRELFDLYQELLDFAGDPVLEALRTGEVDRIYISGEKAAEQLGWRPETELRVGLEQTLNHIRQRQVA